MINSKPSVKCLSMDLGLDKFISTPSVAFDNIEMISFKEDIRTSRLKQFSFLNESISQIYGIWDEAAHNEDYKETCPRLKRLHIHDLQFYLLADGMSPLSPRGEEYREPGPANIPSYSFYYSPTVEVLEVDILSIIGIVRASAFICYSFPNVSSLFIRFQNILQVSEALKRYNVAGVTCQRIYERIEHLVIEINLSWVIFYLQLKKSIANIQHGIY